MISFHSLFIHHQYTIHYPASSFFIHHHHSLVIFISNSYSTIIFIIHFITFQVDPWEHHEWKNPKNREIFAKAKGIRCSFKSLALYGQLIYFDRQITLLNKINTHDDIFNVYINILYSLQEDVFS